MGEFDYNKIGSGYYHEAMFSGKKIQRFWLTQKMFAVVDLVGNETGNILDIGCGPGSFFYCLREKNKKAKLLGVDLAVDQIKFAKTIVPDAEFRCGKLEDLKLEQESIDIITMIEVIEHINEESEKRILQTAKSALKKGGKFIITTPNYRSLWPIFEFFWNKVSPVSYEEQHINKKNIKTLKEVLVDHGFKISKVKTFFIFSQFVAVFFPNLAKKALRLESKIFPYLGAQLIIEATK